ncbi:oxidoreductase [Azorhizobium oxalatiphilum]|uniref:Oxidoreductase n=1 Tax=Azorhizobium oxalatiphilum TaxID=980631 RepID=A0A917BME2_9HYPH|nr:flavin reductase family protein [Azorhizobium oxalatiphilum]GGF48296.1 oxidoreductase [Azorhizobium oxalatiphilum]
MQSDSPLVTVSEGYRAAMRHLAGAVSVFTTGTAPARTGLTASSLTSFAVDPPTLLICINKASSVRDGLLAGAPFVVNVLADGQREVAERFAGMKGLHGEERFADGRWGQLVTGAPVLEDALASFDCELEEVIERHSHMIVLGRVVATRLSEQARPLLYWARGFRKLEL